MATRALIGFLDDDKQLVGTYNHYDGYPDGLGKTLVKHFNDEDAAEKLAQRKKEQDGVLRVSMGSNAEQEQKVIDIARDAIALMDEQPGTSAIDALQTVIEFKED